MADDGFSAGGPGTKAGPEGRMDDRIGFSKKPRAAGSQILAQVGDNSGGSRQGGKSGGQKGGSKGKAAPSKGPSMRVIAGREKKPAPDVTDHISRQLKALYDGVSKQPIPNRFLDLLSKLDEGSGG